MNKVGELSPPPAPARRKSTVLDTGAGLLKMPGPGLSPGINFPLKPYLQEFLAGRLRHRVVLPRPILLHSLLTFR